MILERGVTSLNAVLAGAVSANQPEVHIDYEDCGEGGSRKTRATQRTALNSTTAVEILASPLMVDLREVLELSIHNKDTANATVTVTTAGGTDRIVVKQTLLPNETLGYSKYGGWYVL